MNDYFRQAFDFSGQVALITGGGSGIGLASAKCLSSAGAQVIITGRREDALVEACKVIGKNATFYVHDITHSDEADAFMEKILSEYGRCDILVHCAGIHRKKPMQDVTISDFRDIMDVHLLGAFALTQAAITEMQKRKQGSIIFISSLSALLGMTEICAYGSAKSAVLGMSRCLAAETSQSGIRVNAVIPGFIDTPMFHQAVDNDPIRQNKILSRTPMQCYGKPEDIGWAVVYLCSPAARFVTGTTLTVDGGCSVGF